MPYNTRRKSLSLTELGIIVPKRSRTQSHPALPHTIAETDENPPSKKSKRAHGSSVLPPLSTTTTIRVRDSKPKTGVATQLSPPPSPDADFSCMNKVDTEGIRDDVVVATIRQLEETGNRPHLVKELATILIATLGSVEKYATLFGVDHDRLRRAADILARSTNPCALISSRLTAYLARPWPAVSPCPLAKALSTSHPRRLYFHLTTMPRQPIPDNADRVLLDQRVISPSLSSASAPDEDVDDEQYMRERHALSPSPEVDLSTPELDEDNEDDTCAPELPTPGAPFSGRSSSARERSASVSAATFAHAGPRRGASPPLEREERDFTQTANAVFEEAQRRRSVMEKAESNSSSASATAVTSRTTSPVASVKVEPVPDVQLADSDAVQLGEDMEIDSDERVHEQNCEAAAALFGQEHLKPTDTQSTLMAFSSPVIAPRTQSLHIGEDHMASTMQNRDNDCTLPDFADQDDSVTLSIAATAHHRPTDLTLSDDQDDWAADLQNPENIALHELDDLFVDY